MFQRDRSERWRFPGEPGSLEPWQKTDPRAVAPPAIAPDPEPHAEAIPARSRLREIDPITAAGVRGRDPVEGGLRGEDGPRNERAWMISSGSSSAA